MQYIIKRGDTLSRIASAHKTTWQELARINNIPNPSHIRVGQRITIPSSTPTPTPSPTAPNKSDISYRKERKYIGWAWVDLHVFEMPRTVKRTVVGNVPGTLKPSKQKCELVINGGFFWAGQPLGPTAIDGKRYGYVMPSYYPLDLDKLEFVSATQGTNVISAYPRLVVNGIAKYTSVETYLTPRHPRTAMGWNKDKVFVVVADGRSTISAGLTMQQLADYMKSLGCVEAINLDGGGSSVAAYNGKIVSRPSDGYERSVVTAISFG